MESANDPFKPANPTTTTSSGFEDSFDNKPSGFGEDSFSSKWDNDPFASQASDPFGGSAADTSAKDVRN